MDKSKLTTDRVSALTGEHEIDGVGVITFRALSRFEMINAQRYSDGDMLKQERYILSCAMIDPVMHEDDVAAWQKASVPGEINALALKVNELSGIAPGSAKEQYKSV